MHNRMSPNISYGCGGSTAGSLADEIGSVPKACSNETDFYPDRMTQTDFLEQFFNRNATDFPTKPQTDVFETSFLQD